jgi:radical SAM superfamily enzyme YgiQ (UPF0313 family)
MNVLLVYPEIPDTFWSFKHALKFIHKRASSPPLGLLTAAAMLPSDWQQRLIDMNVRELTEGDLAWADLVFISGMVVQRDSARQAIARCKERGLKVVAGGPLFTSEYQDFHQVDHFVLNEAEVTLPLFLAHFQQGSARRIYRSEEFADLGQTPFPRWDLVDLKKYAAVGVQFSRGCPYHCEFCNVTSLFGHRQRLKSTRQILAELDLLYALGWRASIFFVDDNFIGNKQVLKKDLLPALIGWRRGKEGITFHTEVSINLADDGELMQQMATAGFDMVFVGIETPDERCLEECSKIQNKDRNLIEDVKRLHRAGLQVLGGFIVGFDSDTPSIFQRQIEFIQKSGIVTAMVGLLQAPAGTRLYERLKQQGRIRGETSGNNVDIETNIITRMSLDTLRDGYRSILQNIYTPDRYYQRLKTFLLDFHPPQIERSLDFQHRMAFLRALYRLGILGRERLHFWKLLLWTGLHRPRLLPQAVTLAIYGHHFRIISNKL